jgi:signal transduction histidine kinase
MRIRKRKLPLLLVIVGILFLLVPLLAYLQYDWLGKVSEREREHMQAALRRTLGQFSEDFDREIGRILVEFHGMPDQVERSAADYAIIYKRWNSSATYPQLIRDIFVQQQASNGVQSLQRLNVADQVWEPAGSIPELARGEFGQPIDATIPGLVIPIFRFKAAPREDVLLYSEKVGHLIIRLNLEYIQKEFIPALVKSDLASMASEYRLQITREGDGSSIIYSSTPGTPIEGEGDASEHLFGPMLGETSGMVAVNQPFTSIAPLTGISEDHVFSIHLAPGMMVMAHAIPFEHVGEFRPNGWRITAVHRTGSLEQAVTQLRRRNLAISFSILALLSASVAIVLVSSARAQRLARQQMEFVSTVSHELRTPLAVICSAGENLADGVVRDSDQLKSYGKVVRDEGRRLTDMVEQILAHAGVRSGFKKQKFEPVDVADIIGRAIRAFESTVRENGYCVETRIASDLPPVLGESGSLTRAVRNLISNAMKYGGEDRWLRVSALAEDRCVKISVQDHGRGIPSSELPHVFEPFFRGRSAVDGQVQGSGLGLSLVKEAVKAHGGRVEVMSSEGMGSTFGISLPVMNSVESSI